MCFFKHKDHTWPQLCFSLLKLNSVFRMLTGISWAAYDPVQPREAERFPATFTDTKTIPRGNSVSSSFCRFHLRTRPALPQEKLQQKNKAIREATCNTKWLIMLFTSRHELLYQLRLSAVSYTWTLLFWRVTWHFQVITGVSHYWASELRLFLASGICSKIKNHLITLWLSCKTCMNMLLFELSTWTYG